MPQEVSTGSAAAVNSSSNPLSINVKMSMDKLRLPDGAEYG